MRVLKQNPWLPSLGVLLAAVVAGGVARADVTTDEPGSIVIFPKVISDGTRDTLIQLTNTSTSAAHVHCVYIDTSAASPGTCSGTTPPAEHCSTDADCIDPATGDSNGTCIICQPQDFDFSLTPLQPTVWRVSTGRDSSDQSNGIFLSEPPGVPQKPLFIGELKCFQTDIDGVPTGGNALKGEATLENIDNGQISEYNGIAIKAINAATVSPVCVGGQFDGAACHTDAQCVHTTGTTDGVCKIAILLDNTTQYNACPTQLVVNHYSEGAEDPFTEADVHSELTLVPCTEDLAGGTPTSTTVRFAGFNEFEQPIGVTGLSRIVPFTCWLNIGLDDARFGGIFAPSTFGSTFGKTRVLPTSSTMPGVLGVLEEFHEGGTRDATAAINLHVIGARPGDTITLPSGN